MTTVPLTKNARQLETVLFGPLMGTFNWRIAAAGVTTKINADGLHAASDGTSGFVQLRKGYNSVHSIREETFRKVAFELGCRFVGEAGVWQPMFRIDHYNSHHEHQVGTEREMTVQADGAAFAAYGIEELPWELPRKWIADADFIVGWKVPAGRPGKVVMRGITAWADR